MQHKGESVHTFKQFDFYPPLAPRVELLVQNCRPRQLYANSTSQNRKLRNTNADNSFPTRCCSSFSNTIGNESPKTCKFSRRISWVFPSVQQNGYYYGFTSRRKSLSSPSSLFLFPAKSSVCDLWQSHCINSQRYSIMSGGSKGDRDNVVDLAKYTDQRVRVKFQVKLAFLTWIVLLQKVETC